MIVHFKGNQIYRPLSSPVPIKQEMNFTMHFVSIKDVPNRLDGVADSDYKYLYGYILSQGIKKFQVTFYPVDIRKDKDDLKKALKFAIDKLLG